MTVINCKEHIKDGMFSLPFMMESISRITEKVLYSRHCEAEGRSNLPHWGMTVKAAGDMRYRIDETNVRRIDTLRRIAERGETPLFVAQPELAHSKIVIDVKRAEDAFMRRVDGMISINHGLLLVVTVADCVPIFLFDRVTGAFGIVHSGWKSTGIAANAVALMKSSYGTRPQDVLAVIGPHIQSMCYTVDRDRAALFQDTYGADCVEVVDGEYHLSLLKANLAVLHGAGVTDENITAASDCTCCDKEYGSFRRETGGRLCAPFTVQAAFCGYVK